MLKEFATVLGILLIYTVFAMAVLFGCCLLKPSESRAQGLGCGMKPIPPLGCHYEDAICVCDANGDNCSWIWACRS